MRPLRYGHESHTTSVNDTSKYPKAVVSCKSLTSPKPLEKITHHRLMTRTSSNRPTITFVYCNAWGGLLTNRHLTNYLNYATVFCQADCSSVYLPSVPASPDYLEVRRLRTYVLILGLHFANLDILGGGHQYDCGYDDLP